jgi:hypothetical protein
LKSWTRTLNLDDAHSLLALAAPGLPCEDWALACHRALPELSMPRRRELIRLVRDGFLTWNDAQQIQRGLFIETYHQAPASAQIHLVDLQWALSHPLTLIAVERIVAPVLRHERQSARPVVSFDAVDDLVRGSLQTESTESLRKTRTVLLGAMEQIGTLVTFGTGVHRALFASRGEPHPLAFGYLVLRELEERGIDGMMTTEVAESSIGVRLTQCGTDHARRCIDWNIRRGTLLRRGDEVARA